MGVRGVAYWWGRCCLENMLLRCDRAHEILADMSSRLVQFREMLPVMEGKADANGWVVEL